jgi:hypothetical protein
MGFIRCAKSEHCQHLNLQKVSFYLHKSRLGAAASELVRAAASGVMLRRAGGCRQWCIWGLWERGVGGSIWRGGMIARMLGFFK